MIARATKSANSAKPIKPPIPGVDVCLTPDCGEEIKARGLCKACRSAASRIIHLGKATEEELIVAGLMLPKESGRPVGPFYAAFLQRVGQSRKAINNAKS